MAAWAARVARYLGTNGPMTRVLVIVHERIGHWNAQLRARLGHLPIRWVETRSASDLERALERSARPVVVMDLGDRMRDGIAELTRAAERGPLALILAIDRHERPGVTKLAREMGATLTLSGHPSPPQVAVLIGRWVSLAARAGDADGWVPRVPPDPNSWEAWVPGV
jgi:hypothetical protein